MSSDPTPLLDQLKPDTARKAWALALVGVVTYVAGQFGLDLTGPVRDAVAVLLVWYLPNKQP